MKKPALLYFVLTLSISSFGQLSRREIKGNKLFELFSYNKAISNYLKADTLSTNGLRNLAEAYRNTHQTEQAEVYYEQLIKRTDNVPEDLFQYAQMQLMNNKNEDSEIWMEKFHNRLLTDGRGEKYVAEKGAYIRLKEDLGKFKIFNLDINTKGEDFGPAFYGNKIVFTSSRKSSLPYKLIWNGNQQSFLNLFEANRDSSNQLTDVKMMSRIYNKRFHDGPATFSKDGSLMVFTRNNYNKKSKDGSRKLKMYYRIKDEKNNWGDIIPFNFNNAEYSVGHPALSANDSILYFISDMPGGKGQTDLYKIERVGDSWTSPVNLGETINTEGREMFPFVHQDNMLFFASDGHVGIGGLDVFVAKINGARYDNIKNIGVPINSPKDDFALILDEKQKHGYFSSNRPGGKGSDDIYSFNLLTPFSFCKEIKGVAYDKENNILADVEVELTNKEGVFIDKATTNAKGEYSFCIAPGNYKLKGTKAKYFDGNNKATTTEENNDPVLANVILEKDPGFSLLAHVVDEKTKMSLDGVNITFNNKIENTTTNASTNNNGEASEPLKGVRLNSGVSYSVTFEKEGYLPKTVPFTKRLTTPGVQKFEVELQKIPSFVLYTLITDKKTGEPIEGVKVTLTNNSINETDTIITSPTGDFKRGIKNKMIGDNISYRYILEANGYFAKELTYNKKLDKEGQYNAHVDLDFTLDPIAIGGDLTQFIEINPINFDLNKSNIRPDAAKELDKIVEVMNKYPQMWVELGAHTDCRGSKKYNEALSDRRAKSSAAYISSRLTTNPERIYGKGYGEERLLNHCECEGKVRVPCSNKEHDINRRTEFRITKFDAPGVKVKANGPKSFDK